jgi:hypothetical protein
MGLRPVGYTDITEAGLCLLQPARRWRYQRRPEPARLVVTVQ